MMCPEAGDWKVSLFYQYTERLDYVLRPDSSKGIPPTILIHMILVEGIAFAKSLK